MSETTPKPVESPKPGNPFKWVGSHRNNYIRGRAGRQPIAIVIHVMDGTFEGTRAWFNNPEAKVSTHYGVSLKGDVEQYVSDLDTAFHAGNVWPVKPAWPRYQKGVNPNIVTLGIEHEGKATTVWPEEMYVASANLVRNLCRRWKIPCDRAHVVGHREIYSKKACPGLCDLDKLVAMAASL